MTTEPAAASEQAPAPPLLWEPSQQRRERAGLTAFMRWLAENRGLSFSDYSELWRWSVDELEDFWAAVWEYFDVISSGRYERVLSGEHMPGVRWFEGAQLNYAEHIFRDRRPDETAILHASELRELSSVSWGELTTEVARVAAGLRALGVKRGDRVVAYLPNVPEAVIAFLACASIGAIWSSCSPDFGARSVIDRFAQIEPKVLFAVDGYRYGGKDFDRLDVVAALQEAMPTLARTVVLPYLQQPPDLDISRLRATVTWSELPPDPRPGGPSFERVDFSHPLWVLYSSGTTGLPKAIVQGHGGILIEQLKKGFLHLDLHPGDRMFWFTTTGWMMWNFLVGCLLTDAAIVLYDGSPAAPDLGALWRLAERTEMTCFGTSAGYLVSCMKEGLEPGRDHDLSALQAIGSTGSPLPPEGFRWVYEHVKPDLWLFSTSGGTDVCTAFVGGCALVPVYEGELQARALGAAVEAFDALVVDVPSRDGSALRLHLFVVLRDGVTLDDELRARIKRRIREDCSPRHVPDEIHQVTEVPRTLSGKVLEVPVKKILMGTPPAKAASVDSLANPQALDFFVALAGRLD